MKFCNLFRPLLWKAVNWLPRIYNDKLNFPSFGFLSSPCTLSMAHIIAPGLTLSGRPWSPALGSLIAAWVRYYTTNCNGLTFPIGFSSSWQWQFTSVWTAAHRRICRSTASRSPVLTGGDICVPPAVMPYRVSGSTLTAVGRSQLLARWPGTHSRIRDPTSSTGCFRRLLKKYLFARY